MGSKSNYTAQFKAQVVLEALKGQKGTAELCSEYQIPPTNLHDWKEKAISTLSEVFVPEQERLKKQKALEQEIEQLHKLIGELTIENNFFKKKFQR